MKSLRPLVGTVAGLAAVAGGWALVATLYTPIRAEARSGESLQRAGVRPQPVTHDAYDPEAIDRDIAFHEGRVARDPGAIALRMLGGAYLARSRESDSDVFAWKAEDAARRALSLRVRANEGAEALLVQSLLEQHRFSDALGETARGLRTYPDDHGLIKLRADVLIERGRLDEAQTLLETLPYLEGDVSRVAIAAHIESLRGHHARSIELLEGAYATVLAKREVPNVTLGWYRTKIATEQEALGKTAEARREFAQALALSPRSYKALLGLARVAKTEGKPQESLKWADEALTVANSLDAVALRGDAHLAMGDRAKAEADYAKVREMYRAEVALFSKMGKGGPLAVRPIDRQFATFAATHAMFAPEALAAAERDLRNRPDEIAQTNLAALKLAARS